jgi:hypothetical protein
MVKSPCLKCPNIKLLPNCAEDCKIILECQGHIRLQQVQSAVDVGIDISDETRYTLSSKRYGGGVE